MKVKEPDQKYSQVSTSAEAEELSLLQSKRCTLLVLHYTEQIYLTTAEQSRKKELVYKERFPMSSLRLIFCSVLVLNILNGIFVLYPLTL